jgi:GT2 family glycosyltransferase
VTDDHAGPRIGWPRLSLAARPLVSIIVSAYQRPRQLRICLASLLAQSYENLELIVVHDGPDDGTVRAAVQLAVNGGAARVQFVETPERKNDWGNSSKEYGAHEFARGEWIGYANDDNYYTPLYVETLIATAEDTGAGFVYSDFVHSHRGWGVLDVRPELCRIDVSGWLARREAVLAAPWPANKADPVADGHHVVAIAAQTTEAKAPGVLWVHN